MSGINIIKIEGKPLEKLIDVISKGIGTIYKPTEIRKKAEAEAYKIEVVERAKNKALAEGKEIEAEAYDRIQERILKRELDRQKNIDNVTQMAIEQINNEKSISDEAVDEDWTRRFFNIIEDISNEEMQRLWAQILVGEVTQPKTYSLRTLELLKNLSKKEAECFIKFGKLAISSSSESFIINFNGEKILENKYQLNLSERLLLQELGLINALDLQFKLTDNKERTVTEILTSGNMCIIVEIEPNSPRGMLNVLMFTKIGQELLRLVEATPNFDYIQLLASKIRLGNKGIRVRYAEIETANTGNISHKELLDIPYTDDEIKMEKERAERETQKKIIEENKAKRDAEREARSKK